MNKVPVRSLSFLSIIFLSVSSASATNISPGPGAFPPDIFLGLTGATMLASNNSGLVTSTNGKLIFDVVAAVYSDPSNLFAAGDLDFVYQVANSANSVDSVGRLTAIDFTGFMTDVGYTATGSLIPGGLFVDGSVAPQLVDRVSADTVGFTFSAPLTNLIGPGQTGTALIIETNATSFTKGAFNVIDGGVSTVNAFEPTVAAPKVPESGSALILLGLGLIGLLSVRKGLGYRVVA